MNNLKNNSQEIIDGLSYELNRLKYLMEVAEDEGNEVQEILLADAFQLSLLRFLDNFFHALFIYVEEGCAYDAESIEKCVEYLHKQGIITLQEAQYLEELIHIHSVILQAGKEDQELLEMLVNQIPDYIEQCSHFTRKIASLIDKL